MANIEKALKKLRENKKRKFVQTVELIINLQNIDIRKEQVNTFVKLPNPTEKKICGFFTKKNKIIDTITKDEFSKYKDPKELKKLTKEYDFFIALAQLMPLVATNFGRALGPIGKMPSPQAGIIPKDDEASIIAMSEKMKKLVKIRAKDRSLKIVIGKEDMSDEEIKANIEAVVSGVENVLPKKKENIKNILIKFTMSKPEKIR